MFKFNFSSEKLAPKQSSEVTVWSQSKEIYYTDTVEEPVVQYILKNCQINITETSAYSLKHFSPSDILDALKIFEDSLKNQPLPILKAEESHSDLHTAIYEGGLKIWECTFDLLNYIADHIRSFKDKVVLDLGCGAGLIGILSLMNGAKCTFQDYNADVIKYVTIPNVNINIDSNKNMNFFFGDWQSFVNLQDGIQKYDYIFSSETIYNTENYFKLHEVFSKLLKKDGEVYLAAKSYYFGVGGGVSLFQDFLLQKQVFKFETVLKCSEGISREILKITFL